MFWKNLNFSTDTGTGTAGKVNGRGARHGQHDTNCFFHSIAPPILWFFRSTPHTVAARPTHRGGRSAASAGRGLAEF